LQTFYDEVDLVVCTLVVVLVVLVEFIDSLYGDAVLD